MTQGTAALVENYSAVESMRAEYGTDMTNAFTARSYRNAGMPAVTPEVAGLIHEANRLVVQGKVNIGSDRSAAEARSDIAVGKTTQVRQVNASGNDSSNRDAA